MRRVLPSSLVYLAAGAALALILTGLSGLLLPYHASINWFAVGLLYLLVGFSLTDSQSLSSKSCAYQRSVDPDTRVRELLEAGDRFEGHRYRIFTSYAYGLAFITLAYFWP